MNEHEAFEEVDRENTPKRTRILERPCTHANFSSEMMFIVALINLQN